MGYWENRSVIDIGTPMNLVATYDAKNAESIAHSACSPRLRIGKLFRVSVTFTLVVLTLSCFFITRNPEYICVGLLAVAVTALFATPMYLRKTYDIIEPLSLVVAMSLVGVSYKTVFIVATLLSHNPIVEQSLLGHSPSVLLKGLMVSALGAGVFAIGYHNSFRVRGIKTLFTIHAAQLSERKVTFLSLVLLLAATIGFIGFVKSEGISFSDGSSISKKRFLDSSGGGTTEHREAMLQSGGYFFYRLASSARLVAYIQIAHCLLLRKSLMSLSGAFVGYSTLLTVVLYTVMNMRAGTALFMLDLFMISVFFLRRIPMVRVALLSGATIALTVWLLSARFHHEADIGFLITRTIAGGDLLEVSKTAHIINAIPDRLPYSYGESLWSWIVTPVPKSIWPGKPMFAEIGVHVNNAVFGANTTTSGVTVGVIPELYWCFGIIGVFFGMLIYGSFLGTLTKGFQASELNVGGVMVFSILSLRMTLFVLGSTFGVGVIKSAMDLVPLLAITFLARQRRESQTVVSVVAKSSASRKRQ
jgi:hypothetical protein